MNRRQFIQLGSAGLAASAVSKVAMAAIPEPVMMDKAMTQPVISPNKGRTYKPETTIKSCS